MVVPSRERFAALYEALERDERRAFVAALWDACGWETTVEGDVVVAVRDGRTRRLRVEVPPADDAVDPGSLRDRLLYAIDREEGERLFREYFDTSLEGVTRGTDDDGSATTDSRGRDRGGSAADIEAKNGDPGLDGADPTRRRSLADRKHPIAALAVVCVVLGIAVAGVWLGPGALGDPTVDRASDAEPTGTNPDRSDAERGSDPRSDAAESTADGDGPAALTAEEEAGLEGTPGSTQGPPPGIFLTGVDDPDRVAAEHLEALEGIDALTLQVTVDGPREATPAGTPPGEFRVRIEDDAYRFEAGPDFGGDDRETAAERYGDGEYEYVVVEDDGGRSYERRPLAADANPTRHSARIGADLVETHLIDPDADVTTALADGIVGYRVNATEPPAPLANTTDGYRATAFVAQTGVVLELEVTYHHYPTGADVRIAFRYEDVGETVVEPPAWYDAAKSRSRSRSRSATG
ncbi:hypothetical protein CHINAEXTREME_13485 [Halobiforma lacisalsi AJ5]|uniref:Uncharacterized protein n=1 Tax=Natronobacterium lacisalsi AJ5 TaxID=358396 RepID=M0LJL3_NATLA|nr:hypothetical protein [Halobiforma lacisalsi]APW98732.1 hypothetical protein CHINAEXTREME_13485 [Halobiforma lacisalsi AJ5]EMA32604.1 hypothetical protein C445_10822 [Halobiforma lacisalsi AJ5]